MDKAKMNRIREQRERSGLTLRAASRALGVGVSTLSTWERGEHEPTEYMKSELARFFGTTVDVLFPEPLP